MQVFATPRTPAERAADAIHSAAIHLLRSVRRRDAQLDMGPAGLSVLSILAFGGPKTMGQLAMLEQVRKATMTRIVKRLERSLLAQTKLDANDRRRVLVSVTSLGRTVIQRARAGRVDELQQRMSDLPDSEIALLLRAAQIIEQLSVRDALP